MDDTGLADTPLPDDLNTGPGTGHVVTISAAGSHRPPKNGAIEPPLIHIPWHSFALGQRYTGLIFHTYAPHNAPTFMLISSAIMDAIVGQGTTRCFVAPNAQQKNLRQQRGGSNASCYG